MNAPSVAEQRAIVLGDRLDEWKKSAILSASEAAAADRVLDTGWRTSGTLARIAFFIFGLIAAGCLYGLFDVFDLPFSGFVACAISCGVAELLIRKKKMFHGGIEEGLWLGGLCAFIVGLPGEGKPEAILLFAAASAIAGLRTRTAIVALCAPLLVVAYIAIKVDSVATAGYVCLALGVIASVLQLPEFNAPFVDETFVFATVVCPVAAYVMVGFDWQRETANWTFLAAFGAAALLCWFLAIRAKSHPHLVTALLLSSAIAFEESDRIAWTADAKLVAAGAGLLLAALLVDRLLRNTTPVTSKKLVEASLIRAGEIVASAVVAAAATTASQEIAPSEPAASHSGGGGGFGGAGASGDY